MPAIGSPQPPVSRKSRAGQILFAVALLLIARFLWTRVQPERLAIISIENYKVSGDHFYTISAPGWELSGAGKTNGVYAQSMHEPKWRTLVPRDARYSFYQPGTWDIKGLSVVDGNLYYAVKVRSRSRPSPTSMPLPPENSPGRFLLSPPARLAAQISGQEGVQKTSYPPSADEVRFRQVSLLGGTPRDVVTLRGEDFCLVENHVFWIRPAMEEAAVIRRDETSWLETTANSDLMETSLPDGATRCIRHGIYRYAYLSAQQTGITWQEAAPYPGKPILYYTRASDGAVYALNMIGDQTPQTLLELGGRFYWTVFVSESRTDHGYEVLMSSNLDGTDVRTALQQIDKHAIDAISLSPSRNTLYCCLDEKPLGSKDHPLPVLCRLYPDPSHPIEILRKLPEGAETPQFDGGYLYFDWHERHRSLWANLTDDDVDQTFTDTLCRIPLDH